MPKTATERNKATNWDEGGIVSKKKNYSVKKMDWSGDQKQDIFLMRPFLFFFLFILIRNVSTAPLQSSSDVGTTYKISRKVQ